MSLSRRDNTGGRRRPPAGQPPRSYIAIDPIECKNHGHCVDLLPELIEPGVWAPRVVHKEVPRHLESEASEAVTVCPVLAFHKRKIDREM